MSKLSRSRHGAIVVPALAAVLALSACSPAAEGADSDTLAVVATTTQLADFASHIGGDDIALTSLLQPGASAHHFDPSPKELVALSQADVLIVNGAELEGFIDSAIEASGFNGELVTAADGIDLAEAKEITAEGELEAETGEVADHSGHDHADHGDADHDHTAEAEDAAHESDDHAEHDHAEASDHADHDHGGDEAGHEGHDHGDLNPHIWTSPRYASAMAAEVARGLAAADPAHAADYETRAAAYEEQLAALDAWVGEQFAAVPAADRVLVSGHDSLRYFLHDYDIAYAGAIMPSFEDNAEPSAAELDALSAKIRDRGVRAIFVESSMSPKLAQTIARETGITVVDGDALYADSLGAAGSGAETYVDATVHNTRVILEAWGATPGPVPEALGEHS
ncbi:metal ABC transporter substrate-binding protein [Leucobacter aridicollis]|uniref:Zinc/manganese transport system substrate-binding protein/manganese/iron transport system substrate-binding protein n=1 Tax=Leucobacter aridicollis TaxID=283878 RepID=A0A852RC05_9MICO|nr:metal ABC transporter substrate-binding protein [Leucobacter aridicollis]MBL3683619.1 zinc ABC transporter substrate-binding protein [Leucobacter aridicollis]NYD28328.1 zinc/manganese transport system substrate-binding protein/manganese/iron transport system substrate-binding protein [Leucobacter aridicollis]